MVSRNYNVERMLLEEDYSILYITRSLDSTIAWLLDNSLVLRNPICPSCMIFEMKHVNDATKADKISCPHPACYTSRTFRWKTFFEDHKLSLMEQIQIILHFLVRNEGGNRTYSCSEESCITYLC